MSKENQNSARNTLFEIEARRQKAFVEATEEKVAKHQGLNDEEIKDGINTKHYMNVYNEVKNHFSEYSNVKIVKETESGWSRHGNRTFYSRLPRRKIKTFCKSRKDY